MRDRTERDSAWELHASWWEHEFTDGEDVEYVEQILPLIADVFAQHVHVGSRVLDIGCGEGQVARQLASDGYGVIGLDPTHALLGVARQRAAGPSYVRAGAASLPLKDSCTDAAVVCLVFEHLADITAAIGEVARVLKDEATFLLLLNHPLIQIPGSGWIDDHMVEPPEQYWRLGPYLEESSQLVEVQKDIRVRFFHRPLSVYLNTLISSGFCVDELYEPVPSPGFLDQSPRFDNAEHYPRLLAIRCHKSV